MPIHLDEVETQVDVETPGAAKEPPRTQAPPETLPRWQEAARRDAQLRERLAAWGFDD